MHSIVDVVRLILEKTPPEISSDIIDLNVSYWWFCKLSGIFMF